MSKSSQAQARLAEARRLSQAGSPAAEQAYRAALALDPGAVPAVVELNAWLLAAGRASDAVEVTAPHLRAWPAPHAVLAAHAEALKAAGEPEQALQISRRAAQENPFDPIAAHNLASALGDQAQYAEAEAQARRALAGGLDGAQTWTVLARALQGLGRLDEAQAAFDVVLDKAPLDRDLHRDIAQLVWMRTANPRAALARLDTVLRQHGPVAGLMEVRAMACRDMGDVPLARETIEAATTVHPGDAQVLALASHLAILDGDASRGLAFAANAARAAPTDRRVHFALCEAFLANGEIARAVTLAERLHAAEPLAQDAIAYLATAWRLAGDDRYGALYDYETLVVISEIDTPEGWSSLPAYLADLTAALQRGHVFSAHPFSQSLIGGSQMTDLLGAQDPAIRALFAALAGPIARTLQALGTGKDPLRARNTFKARYQGAWSVRLSPGGGRHRNHIHPKGWLSSACYIDLPDGVTGAADRQGWLTFGEPGLVTQPRLGAEWFVEPQPGRLALFPSYMWHGALPFQGAGQRLTVAFDLLPQA